MRNKTSKKWLVRQLELDRIYNLPGRPLLSGHRWLLRRWENALKGRALSHVHNIQDAWDGYRWDDAIEYWVSQYRKVDKRNAAHLVHKKHPRRNKKWQGSYTNVVWGRSPYKDPVFKQGLGRVDRVKSYKI